MFGLKKHEGEAFSPSTQEMVKEAGDTQPTFNMSLVEQAGVTVGEAEAQVAAAHPETLKEEQAEFNQEVKDDVAALPNEVAEAPAQDITPTETAA